MSRSTLERIWSTYFDDVKIPASNRFSKCEHCERLKKMIHTGAIEAGHNLSKDDYEKLQHDKVENICKLIFRNCVSLKLLKNSNTFSL